VSDETAILKVGDKSLSMPVIVGTENDRAIDISKLLKETGHITIDEGYANTGATTSAITYLDGDRGVLRYRGYPIEQLAEKCDFLETSYLLIYGELPTPAQLDHFKSAISHHTMLHEDMKSFYNGFPRDAHPMAILSSVVAAYSYKKAFGQPFIYPDNSQNYCENFLHMMFSVPSEKYKPDPDFVKALNLLLIVHADHEQNCSTSTVRLVGSSDANLFASISAGICALWGPLHGGANEACVNMLKQIADDGGNVKKYVDLAKDKSSNFRLMGFGHRVYKNYDPRATIIKQACDVLLKKLNLKDPLFDVAQELEAVALKDPYFVERKLYPNVDFYSGVIYRAMGIPVQMFTVLFAMGRLPGWIAHWCEMQRNPNTRIGRPRQVYTGPLTREVRK
jgi:citrate synthase